MQSTCQIADRSVLTPYGYQSGSCGYCKDESSSQRTPNSRASYYAKSKRLSPRHYQILMDRGWRRSGQLLYLPDNRRSCCPHYTIRLAVADFRPSRDQRQTLHRWNRFILGETFEKDFRRLNPKIAQQQRHGQKNGFDLCTSVHASEYSQLARPADSDQPLNPQPVHKYDVTLEKDTFSEEKFLLFQRYQKAIHHEPPEETTRPGFKRFLCNSPILNRESPHSPSSIAFGSYHQLHRLDGRLIAMSVLDILPHGISAVYFIYEPEFHQYGLGKVSALREASIAVEEGIEYYYMGYYIHSCPKMRYKAEYKPQQVLDLGRLTSSQAAASMGVPVWRVIDAQVTAEMDTKTFGLGQEQHMSKYTTPLEAQDSGKTMFELHVPGIVPLATLLQQLDLSTIKVLIGHKGQEVLVPIHLLVGWSGEHDEEDEQDEAGFTEQGSLKSIVAELAAAVGAEVAGELAVGFGSS